MSLWSAKTCMLKTCHLITVFNVNLRKGFHIEKFQRSHLWVRDLVIKRRRSFPKTAQSIYYNEYSRFCRPCILLEGINEGPNLTENEFPNYLAKNLTDFNVILQLLLPKPEKVELI